MNECSACHVDYYYNPDVRVFFSAVCDHRVCESCITRLFQPGPYKCPACERQLVAEDFSQEPREARQVESEVKVRRQISEIYCKTKADFASEDEYNDYLTLREDMVYRLVNPASQDEVQETWREIDKYREQNAAQIRREQRLAPRKKFQKIVRIIEEEGTFFNSVNLEWGESPAKGSSHPFKTRYQSILSNPPQDDDDLDSRPSSGAFSPDVRSRSPLGGGGPPNIARHMNGGGHSPDVGAKKARHFLFADLVAATSASTAGA